MLRVVEHLPTRTLFDYASGIHHTDAVAQRTDDAEVVGDHQYGGITLLAEHPHEVEHFCLDRGIETRGGLVEDQQLGVARQRHGDDDALLHTAGQLERIAIHHACGIGNAHFS
jgi:hypothetical protein